MKTDTMLSLTLFVIGVFIGFFVTLDTPVKQNTNNTAIVAMDTCSETIEGLTSSLDICEHNLTAARNESYVVIDAAVTAQEHAVKALGLLDRCLNVK